MALSVIKRPQAYTLSNPATKSISKYLGPYDTAAVSYASHGLETNQIVYIKSPIEDYNGFWNIEKYDSNFFFLLDDLSARVPWINDTICDVSIYNFTHGWNCIHLPIVYKLLNTKWPTNSEDTVRTISSVTDTNGYCALSLSGDIKATGSAAALEYIKITGATNDDLNGVWQITSYTNDTTFIIEIPYSSANDTALTGASIQYYYNNYHVKVQIYGGLNSIHLYESEKPYVLLSTLDITPDEDGLCMFSISEHIKKQVEISNNLLLGTLPNNLDAFTSFYISYTESYDDSDGTTLTTFTGTYTSDQSTFEGYAINAKLPFKNVYSGAMSSYISGDTSQKFLTLFDSPVLFENQYFDISWINSILKAFTPPSLADGSNQQSGTSWTVSSTPSVTLADGAASKVYVMALNAYSYLIVGTTYRIAYSVTRDAGVGNFNIAFGGATNATATSGAMEAYDTLTNSGTFYGYVDITILTADKTYLYFYIADAAGADGGTYTLNDYWIYPLDDEDFADAVLRQGTEDIEINITDYGVYRQSLSVQDCDDASVDVTLYRNEVKPFPPPGSWTNGGIAFTTKTFTTFTTTAINSTKIAYVELGFTILTGQKLRFSVTTTLSAPTSDVSRFNFYLLSAGLATITSDDHLTDIPAAAGSNTYDLEITANANTSVYLLCAAILDTGGGGAGPTLTITVPETVTLQTTAISETKTLDINCDCLPAKSTGYNLSWLNYLGGFDYWYFTAYSDKIIDITDSGETKENIFPEWPNSYGEFADTIRKQTFRDSREQILIRSQHVTLEQLEAIRYIKTSPLVQIVNSIYDRRTVLVDTDSFTWLKEESNLYEISFTITYTDDVPSQRV